MTLAESVDGIGHLLAYVREKHGVPQGNLAKSLGTNTSRIFRIENGEVIPTDEEIASYLNSVGTQLARDCLEYLGSEWSDNSRRPSFPHPNWRTLLEVDKQLARIEALKADPETKAVFVRALDLYAAELVRCESFLRRTVHHLVFVGIISVGKTSAICTSVGLTLGESVAFARRMVLEVGGGRITLCEVRVESGPQFGLLIDPCTDEEVRRNVLDYADQLLAGAKRSDKPRPAEKAKSADNGKVKENSKASAPDETPWISEEMARAIRGLAKISETEASELAKVFPNREELSIQILSRMDLLRRRESTIWCSGSENATKELEWLQKVFKDINNGRRPGFSLPKRITVIIPRMLFDSDDLSIGVVDTKGIDQSSSRGDIDSHFDDAHALVFLCTKFGEAPDLATMNLIKRAKALHSESSVDQRIVLLVLPRNDEALEMKDEALNDYVESAAAGYDAKLAHIRRAMQPLGADSLPVRFLNATAGADISEFRKFVIEQLSKIRQQYVDRVADVIQNLDKLVEHRTTEEHALAHAEVMEHLRIWTRDHRRLDDTLRPDHVLVQEIRSTHPRTLWASVRREGDWGNFDYYYQLGYATRQLVAATAGEKVKNLKAVIENLAGNPEYADAREFLRQISEHVDSAVDNLTRQVQLFGQTIYRDPLHSASDYWRECEDVYGRGRSYRNVVADDTNEWFDDAALAALHRRLNEEVSRGWAGLLHELDEILEAPTVMA